MGSKDNDFFGGVFDLNGDGKTDAWEEYLVYKMFEETTEEKIKHKTDSRFIPTHNSAPKAALNVTPSSVSTQSKNVFDTLSKENYPQRKRTSIECIVISIIVGLLMSFLPLAVIWATIAAYDSRNSAYWLVFLIFAGGGIAVLCVIWYAAGKSIYQECTHLRALKENYRQLFSDEEFAASQKKKRMVRMIAACTLCAVIAVLIAVPSIKLSVTYNKAVSLVENGSYNDAKELFEEIEEKNYHNTATYIALCQAHIDYDRGYITSAYFDMHDVQFPELTPEQYQAANDFMAVLIAEYDKQSKEKAEAKTSSDRTIYAVPYVGMLESQIGNTSLGAPSSDVRHNYECIGGEQHLANLYDFKQGNSTIFVARCIQGVVTEVWDHRNTPLVPYTPAKSTKSKQNDDPYNVNDYSNEEDFYYDHYDDFFDYYDAEDYYNEHHK